MIEIQQGDQPSATLVKLMRQLADARRGLYASEQALSERGAELEHCRPMADAAHTYCALLLLEPGDTTPRDSALDAMVEAHQATTPSPEPSTHVIVERAELERLQEIDQRAGNAGHGAVSDTGEYEQGWLDAAHYIYIRGAAKDSTS